MKKYLYVFFISVCLFSCTLNKKTEIIVCSKNIKNKYRNKCELEYWENKNFKGYKSQNWKNYQDD